MGYNILSYVTVGIPNSTALIVTSSSCSQSSKENLKFHEMLKYIQDRWTLTCHAISTGHGIGGCSLF